MTNLDTPQSRLVIFIILVILMIPSIVCSLFIFYHLIRSRELRKRVNNHVILVLLIITFTQVTFELPLSLSFLCTGSTVHKSNEFCQFWIMFNYILCTSGLWTMATACIERYWLVFHRIFFDKHLILLHYLPITLCIVYPLILYPCLIIKYPCESNYDYTQWTCGGGCYLYQPTIGTFDWVMDGCVNVILSVLATLVIIIRVLVQKHRALTQRSIWHRSRRLIVQLLALSSLYTIVWLPCVICFIITLFTPVPFLTSLYSAYLSYYQYLSSLLYPFMCLLGLPEIRQPFRKRRQIQPQRMQTPFD